MPVRSLFSLLFLVGCGVSPGTPDAGTLQWFATCGDPVCNTWTEKPGVPACSSEAAGATCGTADATCDPKNDCNALLKCTTSDPRLGPGGCPISRRRYKKDVRYLDRADLQHFADEVRALRLATYRYSNAAADTRERLGFLIDDVGPGVAVDPAREQVDLYGYASLAIAALQVQGEELAALRKEVEALKAARAACPPPRPGQ